MTEQPAPIGPIRRESRRDGAREPAVQQPLADGAVLSRPRRQPCRAAVQVLHAAVGVHPARACRQGDRHHPRRAQPDRCLADRQPDPDRGVLGLREFRLEDRSRRPSGLAGMDDQGRFRRPEAEAAGFDRRDFGDPGAEGLHEHRRRRSTPEVGLAGRRASGVRGLGPACWRCPTAGAGIMAMRMASE